jgi:hypothetical protein
MAIHLDSAIPDEAGRAVKLGFVRGITTRCAPCLYAAFGTPGARARPALGASCD